MFNQYGDRVQFLVVYIKEAHALDSRAPMGGGDNPIVEDPVTLLERQQVAQTCMTKLELEPIPALLDDLDDTVSDTYEAWPDRLFLVGKDGRMAFKGGPGPFGFDPEALAKAIEKELAGGGE